MSGANLSKPTQRSYPSPGSYEKTWADIFPNMLLSEPIMSLRESINTADKEDLAIPDDFMIGVIFYSASCLERAKIFNPKTSIGSHQLPQQSSKFGYLVPKNVKGHQIYSSDRLFSEDVSWVISLTEHIDKRVKFGNVDYRVILITAGYDEIKAFLRDKDSEKLECIARDFVDCLAEVADAQQNSVIVFSGCVVDERGFDTHPSLFLSKVWQVLEEYKADDGGIADRVSRVFYIDTNTLNYPESVIRDETEQLGYVKCHIVHFLNWTIGFALSKMLDVKEQGLADEISRKESDQIVEDSQQQSSSGEEYSSEDEANK
jgi:hypothetical protein